MGLLLDSKKFVSAKNIGPTKRRPMERTTKTITNEMMKKSERRTHPAISNFQGHPRHMGHVDNQYFDEKIF